MKKLLGLILGLGLILIPSFAWAAQFEAGEVVSFPSEKVVQGDFYVGGRVINFDGVVEGDLLALGGTINISGEIKGNLIALGANVVLKGKVGKAARIGGGSVVVEGEVGSDLLVFGSLVDILEKAKIGGDLIIGGGTLNFEGQASGSAKLRAGKTILDGQIGQEVRVYGEREAELVVGPKAILQGNLIYYLEKEALIAKEAQVSGEIIKREPLSRQQARAEKKAKLFFAFVSYLSTLLVALILIKLKQDRITQFLTLLAQHPYKSLFAGLVVLIIGPVISILLLMSIFGLHLGVIILGLYILALYLAKILVSLFVGEKLLNYSFKKSNLYLAAALGLALYTLGGLIPLLGGVMKLVVLLFGLGGLYLTFRQKLA